MSGQIALGIVLFVVWFVWMLIRVYHEAGEWVDAWFEDRDPIEKRGYQPRASGPPPTTPPPKPSDARRSVTRP
jgi:hypothetical protein